MEHTRVVLSSIFSPLSSGVDLIWFDFISFILRHSCVSWKSELSLPSILKTNPRRFWSIINPKQSSSQPRFIDDSDSLLTDFQSANLLNEAFSSVFTKEDTTNIPSLPELHHSPMSSIDITKQGISNIIANLKTASSPGDDNISTKLLKGTNKISSCFLVDIFKQSLTLGEIPTDWKIGWVIPVFKAGSHNSPLNYRPISLTSIPSKILEHIIYSNVATFLDANFLISPCQHGFRKGFSCESQLLVFTNDLHANFNSHLQTDAIFLDFSKAFDKVPYSRLITKLKQLKLDTKIIIWISQFLTSRTQYVSVNNTSSLLSDVTSGVPQGSVLSPLLFSIFINDLSNSLSSSVRLYADDCVVYRSVNTYNDHLTLQDDLNKICSWCSDWQMSLNFNKCKLVSFSRLTTLSHFTYTLDSYAVLKSPSYKYLGVLLTEDLHWREHINSITKSANQTLGYLRRNLHFANPSLKRLAYITFIRPKLEYASSIWSPWQNNLINDIESIQNRAARFIFSDFSHQSSVTLLRLNADLQPLAVRRKIARVSLIHKIYYHNSFLRNSLFQTPHYTSARRDNSCKIRQVTCSSVSFSNSTLPLGIADWNSLPNNIVTEANSDTFHNLLTAHLNS